MIAVCLANFKLLSFPYLLEYFDEITFICFKICRSLQPPNITDAREILSWMIFRRENFEEHARSRVSRGQK